MIIGASKIKLTGRGAEIIIPEIVYHKIKAEELTVTKLDKYSKEKKTNNRGVQEYP